ncbi:HU family DNA-binding protein [Desulfomonile tiedjei]|uniref:Bacterial nucleoid DNA-binding protein n=1 Tax=Desulfomonile tiedjei (strain ATCC 49306 / DSM 6799 / DCB-1) TaxID=706587 RepID=I4C7D4_DESTA|nr:HU family DNA-binding protein [Desulfomonile tiedjei]AFM25475.1 bacterial nucleoid DNA-binding protein [Desulfomonile tiedjei DSM 6799]
MSSKKIVTDAYQWSYDRYLRDEPELAEIARDMRSKAEEARQIYDARVELRLTREKLARLSGLTPAIIEDLEESDYEGDWAQAMAQVKRALHGLKKRGNLEFKNKGGQKARAGRFTKAELLSQIAIRTKVSPEAVNEVLKSLIEAILEGLKEKGEITIPALGTFTVVKKPARIDTKPQTKTEIETPVSKTPHFKAAKSFQEAIKNAK